MRPYIRIRGGAFRILWHFERTNRGDTNSREWRGKTISTAKRKMMRRINTDFILDVHIQIAPSNKVCMFVLPIHSTHAHMHMHLACIFAFHKICLRQIQDTNRLASPSLFSYWIFVCVKLTRKMAFAHHHRIPSFYFFKLNWNCWKIFAGTPPAHNIGVVAFGGNDSKRAHFHHMQGNAMQFGASTHTTHQEHHLKHMHRTHTHI